MKRNKIVVSMLVCLLMVGNSISVAAAAAPAPTEDEQSMAVVCEYEGVSFTPAFTDVQPGDPYFEAVEFLAAANIVSGRSDGTFGVYDNATVWETLAVIERTFGKKVMPEWTKAGFTAYAQEHEWIQLAGVDVVNNHDITYAELAALLRASRGLTPEFTGDQFYCPEGFADEIVRRGDLAFVTYDWLWLYFNGVYIE